jgi:hypothetical protein
VEPADRHVRQALESLSEDACLHQVVTQSPGRLRRYVDLPIALASAPADAAEWRVHAHVPLAFEPTGALGTTRRQVTDLLASLGRLPSARHFEVETYAWGALTPAHRRGDVVDGIVRELEWTLGSLADVAKSA